MLKLGNEARTVVYMKNRVGSRLSTNQRKPDTRDVNPDRLLDAFDAALDLETIEVSYRSVSAPGDQVGVKDTSGGYELRPVLCH